MEILKPSTVMRRVKANKIADPQPSGEGVITCQRNGHKIGGDTESPTFWESGVYVYCRGCKALVIPRVTFKTFAIDLSGERKKYPLIDRALTKKAMY